MSERDETAVTVRLPNNLYDQLKQLAEQHERSLSGMLRWLVREYLRESERSAE